MNDSWSNLYRPSSLKKVIGNTSAVTTLQGYINCGVFPPAVLLTGPTGCGKTTLARAWINDVNGRPPEEDPTNVVEMNMASTRSIDDIRALTTSSRYLPSGVARRFIILDEAQQVLSNAPAAQALLKPLEDAISTTTYILCSMEPEKFSSSQLGRALAKRCTRLKVGLPSEAEKRKFAHRILKAESVVAVTPDTLPILLESADGFRDVAFLLESVHRASPDTVLSEAALKDIVATAALEDTTARTMLEAIYSLSMKKVVRTAAAIAKGDGVGIIGTMLFLNWNALLAAAGCDARGSMSSPLNLSQLGEVNAQLVSMRERMATFAVDEKMLIVAVASNLIRSLSGEQ